MRPRLPRLKHVRLWWTVLLPITLVSACAGSEGDDETSPTPDLPEVDCTGAVPTYTELSSGMLVTCMACHSSTLSGSDRGGAPSTVNFDTYAAAVANAEEAVAQLHGGRMPLPDPSALPESDKQLFYTWALCDTPE